MDSDASAATCPVLLDREQRGTLKVNEWLGSHTPLKYRQWAEDNLRRGVLASVILGVLSERGYTKLYRAGAAATTSPPQPTTQRGGGRSALGRGRAWAPTPAAPSSSSAASLSSAHTARDEVRARVVDAVLTLAS